MKNPAMKSHPKATHYVLAHKSASTVSGSTNRRPEAKKNGTLRSFFPIFRYLCPQIRFSAHSTRGGVKREPGANPGQSRCCETPQRSVISATDPPRGSGRLRNGSKSEDLPIRFDVGCSRGLGIRFRLYSNVISERAPLRRPAVRSAFRRPARPEAVHAPVRRSANSDTGRGRRPTPRRLRCGRARPAPRRRTQNRKARRSRDVTAITHRGISMPPRLYLK